MIIPNKKVEEMNKIIYTVEVNPIPLLPMCQYISIRAEVKENYHYHCQLCFEKFHPTWLQIHHIKPKRDGRDDSIHNLIPFCAPCHLRVHKENITHNRYQVRIYMPQNMSSLPKVREQIIAQSAA